MTVNAIVIQKLEHKYRERQVLHGLSLTIGEGEIFGLLGPNGAGKTTAISLLTGLLQPTGGEFSIFGKTFAKNRNELKRLIGIVPQTLAIYDNLTALDNLRFFGRIYGLARSELESSVMAALRIVKLEDRANDDVASFSGGMKRRLNLAVALIHRPRVLFLDEPTVGVDPQSRNAIFESIVELNKQGVVIIYTTHYMEEAQRLCHRIAIMDEGSIVALDTPANLCKLVGEGLFKVGIAAGDAPRLVAAVRALPSVREVRLKDNELEIDADALHESLMRFMEVASEAKVRLASLNIHESNLETVFLKLTGKNIRDL